MKNNPAIIDIARFLDLSTDITIVDVRTPAEHKKGYIPGSVNIPLFSDNQRAAVGTIYKRKGNTEAILKGLDYVGPEMSALLKKGLKLAGEPRKLLVHCWRGGMRSASMAWLFSLGGIECYVLEGGYKSYRTNILAKISELKNIIVVGGLTGSGKTEILNNLRISGEQVIDLEKLANHRGSAFGAIGMPTQPTSEQFSNLLYEELRNLDYSRRIFLEDESLNIGSVFIPEELYSIIRNSPVIAVMCDAENRMPRLLKDYGTMPEESLKESINRIRKRLGGKNADDALKAIESGNIAEAIRIILAYYDKSYWFGLQKRGKEKVIMIDIDSQDIVSTTNKVIEIAKTLST